MSENEYDVDSFPSGYGFSSFSLSACYLGFESRGSSDSDRSAFTTSSLVVSIDDCFKSMATELLRFCCKSFANVTLFSSERRELPVSKEGPSPVLLDLDFDYELSCRRLETFIVAVFLILMYDLSSEDILECAIGVVT